MGEYYGVGLMCGTSVDGVDAALVRIADREPLDVRLVAYVQLPFSPQERAAILDVAEGGGVADLCRLHVSLGERLAEAVRAVLEEASFPLSRLDFVASHGQTVCHLPPGDGVPGTLQAGSGAVLAERLGVPVVVDFRARDMAQGGHGAPLVPLVDALLYRSPREARACLNLGGIANLTWLPPGSGVDGVCALDCGPGNMVLDGIVQRRSGGRLFFDQGGEMAARGRVVESLLHEWRRHPFFRQPPPRSTGREAFGMRFVDEALRRYAEASTEDLLATAAHLVAWAVADALRGLAAGSSWPGTVLVSGGGVHNGTLMRLLAEYLQPATVTSVESVGGHSDGKEAVAFAVLGYLTLRGRPGNVPAATGARRPVVLGQVVLPMGWDVLGSLRKSGRPGEA